MSRLKQAFYQGIRLVNISLLKQLFRGRLLLPYQHLVSDEEVPHIKHLYPFKGTKAFEDDLDYLLKHFTPVTLEDVISGKPLPEHSFLLTFDDGLREVSTTIAPMLLRKGVPAAFFLNSDFVDNKVLYYHFKISLMIEALETLKETSTAEARRLLQLRPDAPKSDVATALHNIKYKERALTDQLGLVFEIDFEAYLREKRPHMTSEEIENLVKKGFAVGGHSIDHPYYTELSLEEQLRQTLTSVNFVTERFKVPYKAFAFPHFDTGVSRKFFDTLLDPAKPQLDVIFGTANHKLDISPKIYHRFNCERPAIGIEEAVKGIMMYNVAHVWMNRNKILRDK